MGKNATQKGLLWDSVAYRSILGAPRPTNSRQRPLLHRTQSKESHRRYRNAKQSASLEAELGAAPVASLRVVPNLAVCLVPEPRWDLAVLLGLSRQLLLRHERLVGRLFAKPITVQEKARVRERGGEIEIERGVSGRRVDGCADAIVQYFPPFQTRLLAQRNALTILGTGG